MAMKLNAGETGRQDLFSIFPENIVVIPGENGRKEPHSQEEIESLANSILTYGQQQPVVVRRIEDHKVQLVAGYGRYTAVRYINTVLQTNHPVKLQCKVVDLNPEEAFVRNLVENIERAEATNPETGKVVAETVRKRVRAKKIEAGGGKGRSIKEVRTFFEQLTGPAEADAVRGLSEKLVLFLSGKITDEQMTDALEKYTKSEAVAA